MSNTLDKTAIYNERSGLIHGEQFQLLNSFSPNAQGGSGEWLIGSNPQIAVERSLPFARVLLDESGIEQYRVVEANEWEPFSDHFPATEQGQATPVVPGVYSLALAGNRRAKVAESGLVQIGFDLAGADKVRWKSPFFPGDTAVFTIEADTDRKDQVSDNVFKLGQEKPAVEISGLKTTKRYDSLVPSFALVELASHAAGLAIHARLQEQQDEGKANKGKPAFLGLDNLAVLGRIELNTEEVVKVEANVIKARTLTSTASVIITATREGGPTRTLMTIGSLLFGFSNFSQ